MLFAHVLGPELAECERRGLMMQGVGRASGEGLDSWEAILCGRSLAFLCVGVGEFYLDELGQPPPDLALLELLDELGEVEPELPGPVDPADARLFL